MSPYKFSTDFKEVLINAGEGFISGEQFDELYNRFELNAAQYHFTKSSEANLIRIINSLFDKKSFLLEAIKFDHHIEIISAISSYSNYLTDIVVRSSEYLYQIFDQDYLSSDINQKILYEEVKSSVTGFNKIASKTKMVRNFKRKYLLKIGVADILGINDLKETTQHLSELANALSTVLFEECYNEINKKYNVNLPSSYALCSLGKLGGHELNYSSDIDLIIFYEENYPIEKINKEFHELISETVQLFIREATEVTAASYIYRVDFRLRPDGRNSLLTRTLADYLRYYETRGEEWERQMLIKLGFICGDENLYQQFQNFLQGFVYPMTFSNSITESITKMKKSIERRLHDEQNIKLSPGGIRDVEFAVQALQLVNGGRNKELRTGNSLKAITKLSENGLITNKEKSTLNEAYTFFRKIEHFVQLMNDKQTHTIPVEGELRYKLLKYMGFETDTEFENRVNELKFLVREIYEDITSQNDAEDDSLFGKVNFRELAKAENNYKYLAKGISLFGEKQFDSKTRSAFHEIETELFKFLHNSPDPDRVIENFTKIIRSIKIPSVWYSAFSDKLLFNSFLKICQFAQYAVDLMSKSAEHADALLSKTVFQKNNNLPGNVEHELLLFSVQHAIGVKKFPEFSEELTNSVSKIISKVVNSRKIEYNYFLAGLGSFGNFEMSFGSDIDLIVVVENLSSAKNAEKDFQYILAQLKKEIPQFEIDFRLRPEGKNSPLVTDIEGYKHYINERMRVWEFQALEKCKFICGNESLFNSFIKNVASGRSKIVKETAIEEVLSLYKSKMKFGISANQKISLKSSPGALLSIDTIIQLLSITNNHFQNKTKFLTGNEKTKLAFEKTNSIMKNNLYENYIFMKNIQIAVQNCFNQKKSTLPNNKTKLNNLAAYLNFKSGNDLLDNLNSAFEENIQLLNNLVKDYE